MAESTLTREQFFGLTAAFAALSGTSAAAATVLDDPDHPHRVDRALVLSGGGARGAYEGGLIDYYVRLNNIPDGQPLAPYGFVCGTSIGALNGYMVATGQYSLLRELWNTIGTSGAIRLKPGFETIRDSNAGIATRIAEAIRLAVGMTKDVTGVIDGSHVHDFLAQYIKPSTPVVMPFAWNTTNLTRQGPEYFYIVPQLGDPQLRARAEAAVKAAVGPSAVLRAATPDLLVTALQASAAIPIGFDPVVMPSADGKSMDQYCDGGVTANTPIGIARAAARNVDVVMLDPPFHSDQYHNMVEVGLGAFGTATRRILESDVRSAYFETFGKRLFNQFPKEAVRHLADATGIDFATIRRFSALLFASDFYLIRPEKELPVPVGGFDQTEEIYETYKLGFTDAESKGFQKYDISVFQS